MPSWRERASGISGGKNGTRTEAGTFEGEWDSGDGTAGGEGTAALTRDEVITGAAMLHERGETALLRVPGGRAGVGRNVQDRFDEDGGPIP